MKKPAFNTLIIAFVLLLVFPAISLTAKIYQQEYKVKGVIVVKEVEAYSGPSEEYLHAFTLHEGADISIEQVRGDWYEIKLGDNLKGWLKKEAAGII